MRKIPLLILGLILYAPAGAQVQFAVENQIFQSNPAARSSGSMANSLLAMALASLGSVMNSSTCRTVSGAPLPDSLTTFSNTAFIYISTEITEANQHQADIVARNALIQSEADRMRRQGGGEIQKLSFVEAKIERQYLQNFIGVRRSWIASLIIGYNNAASIASSEALTDDTRVICTGTLNAARTVASQMGTAFNAVIGRGPDETVSQYLNDVLDIVAAQILPLSETPEGRAVVASIAADSAAGVLGQLGPQFDLIGTNIDNINEVMNEFEDSNGVTVDSGVNAPRGQVPRNQPVPPGGNNNLLAASSETATNSQSGAATVNPGSGASSAVNLQKKTCTEKSSDGKSLEFKEVCTNVAKFPAPLGKSGTITTRSASDATAKLANALASGDIAAAKIAAGSLDSLAAMVLTTKSSSVKNKNLALMKAGKPMVDLDGETKKTITKITEEITNTVKSKGGEIYLASSAPAMVPEPKTVAEVTRPQDLSNLPARLRGKYFVPSRNIQENVELAKSEPKKGEEISQKESSLWQRLSDRYQLRYEQLFNRKEP